MTAPRAPQPGEVWSWHGRFFFEVADNAECGYALTMTADHLGQRSGLEQITHHNEPVLEFAFPSRREFIEKRAAEIRAEFDAQRKAFEERVAKLLEEC